MFNSKRLKDFELPDRDKWYQKAVDFVKDKLWYPIENFYHTYSERISRSYAFAKIAWLNYDFDAATMWDLLAFKLKRVHKVLVDGHAIQEDEDMNALLEAIAICERLYADEYEDKYYKIHDEKWGELQSRHDRVASRDENGKPLSYYWDSWREKANTPELQEQERQDLRKIWENGHNDYLADLDRLNDILKKHSKTWWD